LIAVILLMIILVMLPLKSPPLPGVEGSYAIRNVNVIGVSDGEIENNMTILIDGGLIIDVLPGEEYRAGEEFTEIPAEGKYAIPALWDMHTHSLKVSPQIHHPLFISKGITGVRDMSGRQAHGPLR
jgi:adenine deaminase